MSAIRIAEDRAAKPTVVPARLLHDLRSPLNQIIGYSEMMAEDAKDDDAGADLRKVVDAGHRILALLDENFTSVEAVATADPDDTARQMVVAARGLRTTAPGLLLVVDDDAGNRDVLSRRLMLQGHMVRTAASGRDALALMRRQEFDLVLLDILMPEIDGYEVLGQIKADPRLQHIPVVMISALSEVQSVVRCLEAGAEDYLTKPFNPTLLRARVGACLEKKRGRDRETALYDELQKNYGRLQELEKLRDDMRNMIVHDLRTPLTAVLVGIELLEKHGDLNETQREMMEVALGGGHTLLGMINDLLDVEKMESGGAKLQYDVLDASTLINSVVAQVATLAAESQTRIVTQLAPLPPFAGDQGKLSRTLVNLIANAIKFTRKGVVTVGASLSGDADVRFFVTDTGAGIPAEAFGKIFEKFGQLDSSKVGTGLGLAFCKLAVEAHGGEIGVESTIGNGSTFWFTVPLARAATDPLRAAQSR
jgi:signal transduction histidine kinase